MTMTATKKRSHQKLSAKMRLDRVVEDLAKVHLDCVEVDVLAIRLERVMKDLATIDGAKLTTVERTVKDHLYRVARFELDAGRRAQRELVAKALAPRTQPHQSLPRRVL